jgi:hypothetical protein
MKLITALILSISTITAQAGESEIRMSQKIIDINKGDLSCGKVIKAEKIQDTSKFLDVKAVCSNGEVYRMATMYGSARDVKVAIQCSKPFTGWGQEAANELGITKTNCR